MVVTAGALGKPDLYILLKENEIHAMHSFE